MVRASEGQNAYANRINQNVVLFCSNLGAKKKLFLLQGKKVTRGRLTYILGGFFVLYGKTIVYSSNT